MRFSVSGLYSVTWHGYCGGRGCRGPFDPEHDHEDMVGFQNYPVEADSEQEARKEVEKDAVRSLSLVYPIVRERWVTGPVIVELHETMLETADGRRQPGQHNWRWN